MPMIEVKLDLVSVRIGDDKRRDEVRFIPDLEESSGKGVRDLINSWVGSFFNVATLFKRLDNEGTYLREIHGDWDVMNLMAIINETLEANEALCLALKSQYEKHEYLWLTDLTEFFNTFKEEAMITTVNGQRLLDLQLYEEAITKYEGGTTYNPLLRCCYIIFIPIVHPLTRFEYCIYQLLQVCVKFYSNINLPRTSDGFDSTPHPSNHN